jgi:cyclase
MREGHLVKGEGFAADRIVGNALQAARIHAQRGVDEILILDVTATKEGREPDYKMIEKLTQTTTVPVTVGGGITKPEHVQKLLNAGADRISLYAGKTSLIQETSNDYGKQCVAVTLDVTEGAEFLPQCAKALQSDGAGEIILQSVTRDGTMQGYDLNLIYRVANSVDIPVVASGGCKDYQDMYNAIQAGASAVAAGALFQFTEATPKGAAQYLYEAGIEVRYEADTNS